MTLSDLDRIADEITAYQADHPERRFVPTETEAAMIGTVLALVDLARAGVKAPSTAAET